MNDLASHTSLRAVLYAGLRSRSCPVLCGPGFAAPGATLWSGARTWVTSFRALGVAPGDRVVLRLPRTPAHVMATIAAWWEGVTLCPIAPQDTHNQADLLDTFDARLIIDAQDGPHALQPTASGAAPVSSAVPRDVGAATPGIALILTTSGTIAAPKQVALSHRNVLHQLTSHRDALGITVHDRVLSVLPWHHAFGLLVDLWPSLLSGATVEVDHNDGRSPASMIDAIETRGVTRISMVPLQASGMVMRSGGTAAIESLSGGVLGGAPISQSLAETVRDTRLRAGYGQTETSPGITLGRPGEFYEGILGRPIGCTTRITNGELHVRGPNVCVGFWTRGRLDTLPETRWHATGDLVEPVGDDLCFMGRRDHRFKLPNGRMVDAPRIEQHLRMLVPDSQTVVLPAIEGGIHIVAFCVCIAPSHQSTLRAAVEEVFGEQRHHLRNITWLPKDCTYHTRKGDLDRTRLQEAVQIRTTAPQLAA